MRHIPQTFGEQTWQAVFDCAPDCDERVACTDVDKGGHLSCGARACGCPRHHACKVTGSWD